MPRRDAKQLGPVTARVIGGEQVKLLDFSRRGVLIESTDRLSIGARATLRIVTVDASISIHGRVVRSKVVKTSIVGLVFHTALELDEDLSVLEAAAQERRDVWRDDDAADDVVAPTRPALSKMSVAPTMPSMSMSKSIAPPSSSTVPVPDMAIPRIAAPDMTTTDLPTPDMLAPDMAAPDLTALASEMDLADLALVEGRLSEGAMSVFAASVGSERASRAKSAGLDDTGDFVLEFMTTVPHDLEELRRRAAVNNW